MALSRHSGKPVLIAASVCVPFRGVSGLSGIRRSLITKLTFVVLLLMLPVVYVAVRIDPASPGYVHHTTLVMLTVGVGLAAFALTARCLVQPITGIAKMVWRCRMGDRCDHPSICVSTHGGP